MKIIRLAMLSAGARFQKIRVSFLFILFAMALLIPDLCRADYRSYNTSGTLDWVMVEENRPYFQAGNWSPYLDNNHPVISEEGASFAYYTGFGDQGTTNSVFSHWSTWPITNPIHSGDALTIEYYGTHTSGHDGEGTNGSEGTSVGLTGVPPFGIDTNVWYRFAMRCWRPADGTPHTGYVGQWVRKEITATTGEWYHIGTYKTPFEPKGVTGLGGFIENYFPYDGAKELRFRNAYVHEFGQPTGTIQSADEVSVGFNAPSGTWVGGYVGLSGDSSYVIASIMNNVTEDPLGNSYPVNSAGNTVTITLPNQPATPAFDPIVVSSTEASVLGSQLLVEWMSPNTSSPQLTYTIDVYDNAGYTGSPVVSFMDRAPEARQKLLDITGIATPYVRLTITDIFDNEAAPIDITPVSTSLTTATSAPGAVGGLDYKYYEAGTGIIWSSLPDFTALTPVRQGAVNEIDYTPRQRREEYGFDYSGYLEVPSDGIYTFTLSSYDSSKLFIDGIEVVDFDGLHQPGEKAGWLALEAGKHPVNIRYAFSDQRGQTVNKDYVSLTYAGPSLAEQTVPLSAWYRVPSGTEPILTLTSPTAGSTLVGSNIAMASTVVPNGFTVDRVEYFVENILLGSSDTAPYTLNVFLGEAPSNHLRARLYYNGNYSLDTSPAEVTINNMELTPWTITEIGTQHLYPTGGKIMDGTYSLVGDSVNTLSREITGDCTLIARLADITSSAPLPDGVMPTGSDKAGIILRSDLSPHTGLPLGLSFFSLYAEVDGSTHYQDSSMVDAGGGYASADLGGAKWFKLDRVGDTCTSSVSTDGLTWSVVNTSTISIGSTIYAALFQFTSGSPAYLPHVSFDGVGLVGDVTGPPEVSVAPKTTSVYIGQSASFTALPIGSAPFNYQWQYNGVDLAGETGATLALANLQPTDSGLYTVVMNNADGTASSTAELSVLTPIPIVEEILTGGSIGYWRLNDAGPTAEDWVGNHDGTGLGGTLFGVAGVGSPFTGFESGNQAAQFNGIDSAVSIPALGVTTANFTITGWAKRNGSQNDWTGLVFGRHEGNKGTGIMVVNNALRFSWDDDGDYNWNSGLTLPDNQWAFFALTIEPTGTTMYMSSDGTTLNSSSWSGSNTPRELSGSLDIGADANGGSGRRFNGSIDEVAFYNRTLSSTELQGILTASKVTAPEVELTAPANGTVLAAPADITLTADVVSNGATISKVQFFAGATLLGEDPTAPYSFSWNSISSGSYTVFAQAVYGGSSTMSSAPANVSVLAAPGVASAPTPSNGASDVEGFNALLSWTAGSSATSHDVYFGTSPTPAFQGNQMANSFDPGSLLDNTTYYWAVNEVNAIGTATGPVWSFTTKSYLVAHWKLDETSGTTAIDSGGNGHDGTSSAVTIDQTGQIGRAYAFNGSSSEVSIPNGELTLNANTVTITGWIKASASQDDYIGLLQCDGGSGTRAGLMLRSTRELRYMWNNGNFWSWGSGLTVPADQWVFVALTIEPTKATIYMHDGTTLSSSSNTTSHNNEPFDGVTKLGSDRSQDTRTFTGLMDDFRLYNRTLSETEIGDLYAAGTDLDSDDDGIPNAWEIAHGLDPLVDDASVHSDSDEFDNWYEYVSDTDPLDGNSRQTFSFEIDPGTGDPTARFSTSANRFYAVEFRGDLTSGNWDDLGPVFPGTGLETNVTDSAAGDQRFYRLRIELPFSN